MSSRTPSYPSGHAPGSGGSRKVAIPRLQRPGQMSDSPRDRRRVSRACTACRSHKIKCSGDSPQCKHCVATSRECIYIMPRRDRLKIITERCVQMATLLRTLRGWASEEDNARIGELLDAVDEDASDIPQTPVPSNPDTDGDESGTSFSGNMRWFSEQVNLDALDLLDENLHENDRSRATGFMGMNSEVQWLRTFLINERLDDKSAREPTPDRRIPFAAASNSEQVSGVTFYLDSDNVDLDFYVEPYGLPTPEIAEKLLATYMDKVHVSFPILPRRLFEDQFRRYFKGWTHGTAPRLNPKWQAILNLVFAIAAKYTHLVKATWRADERDHLIYQARARTFGWNDATLTQHPDLPQIQVAGLLAFYYLSVGQVSRAWVTVGVALRFANALGLHVRNEDPSASSPKKEVLVRVWWSLYSLERQLSIITGRPSVIVDSCCSVPLPLPLPEEQIPEEADVSSDIRRESLASTASSVSNSPTMRNPYSMSGELLWKSTGPGNGEPNSGSYFRAVVQIGIITQNILSSLYTAGTMIRAPGEIHQDIIQLGKRVDQWMASLPCELNFQIPSAGVSTPLRGYYRERTLLGFQYCSARILLTRPCLGGIIPSQKPGKEGSVPASFLRQMANICVEAAKTEIGLLPDRPDPLFVYENAPWWSIVHHLMQAFAVLLLALSGSPSAVRDHDTLGNYAKKTLRWLSAMSDPLAERAYKVALHSFAIVAKRLSLDVSDLRVEYGLASPSSLPNMADQSFLDPGTFSESASSALGSTGHVFAPIPASAPQMAGPPFHGFDASALGSVYSSQPDEMRYDESFYNHRN